MKRTMLSLVIVGAIVAATFLVLAWTRIRHASSGSPLAASSAWESLRDTVLPPLEEDALQFSSSGANLLSIPEFSPSGIVEVRNFEGSGVRVLGQLDSAGVFWLSTSLHCARGSF